MSRQLSRRRPVSMGWRRRPAPWLVFGLFRRRRRGAVAMQTPRRPQTSSRPSATSTASPSRAWKEARGTASRAEVLTNTGRCSCPFVASGVLARYARRVEFLLLATRFEGSRRRRCPRLVPSRAKSCPKPEPTTAAALGKTGRGPGNRGLWGGLLRERGLVDAHRYPRRADKTRQKQPIHKKSYAPHEAGR